MGEKGKSIKRNCQAVSEAIGEVLMIAVVVIAFSSMAVTIFSNVATNSSHIPHTELESTRPDNNTIRILHVGGESINIADMGIFVNFKQINIGPEDINKNSYEDKSTSSAFTLGDCINIKTGNIGSVDLCIIHMPSKKTILKAKL